MKNIVTVVISVILAAIMAFIPTMNVMADSGTGPDYISEIKVGVGETAEEAKAALEGYNIIETDLNENAGGGWGSKGNRVVYLGYKTTKNAYDGITDLALMNMKGGYSVKDYNALMDTQMASQIIPLVDMFLATINEYRANYNSPYPGNRQRAEYIHDALNHLTDDDCGGAGLGDLLLNTTKYEMGDAAYDALSAEEKMQHADILTIVAQANGQATLMLLNLLTKGADTEELSWLERFKDTTYEDMVNASGMLPSDAQKELAKAFDDDANIILNMWDDFQESLLTSDASIDVIANLAADNEDKGIEERFYDADSFSDDEINDLMGDYFDEQIKTTDLLDNTAQVAAAAYLETIPYGDGTMYDFFCLSYEEIAADITVLYPMVASLSQGQRAGLEYISLRELVMMGDNQVEYDHYFLDDLNYASIYEGVDRGIYEKGGVALTSDAQRYDALKKEDNKNDKISISPLTIVFISVSAASALGIIGSVVANRIYSKKIDVLQGKIDLEKLQIKASEATENIQAASHFREGESYESWLQRQLDAQKQMRESKEAAAKLEAVIGKADESLSKMEKSRTAMVGKAAMTKWLSIGFSAAFVVLSGITVYLTYRDLAAYYNVEFAPIPLYMVDEKDITAYNSKGEKIVIKNQSAYYKVCETNRDSGDDYYNKIGTSADLNGAVGKQWLALYSVKNEAESPILASSLMVVTGDKSIPAGYSTGIHMFGSDGAFNLNNDAYIWNADARDTFVYFQRDESVKISAETASLFSNGSIALAGGGGLIIGAALAAIAMITLKKKKENGKADA